jgi:hypothetical protein
LSSPSRTRKIFAAIAPKLLKALADTGDPEEALKRFSRIAGSLGAKIVYKLGRPHEDERVVSHEHLERALLRRQRAGHRLDGHAVDTFRRGPLGNRGDPNRSPFAGLETQTPRRDETTSALARRYRDALFVRAAGADDLGSLGDYVHALVAVVPDLYVLARGLAGKEIHDDLAENHLGACRRNVPQRDR